MPDGEVWERICLIDTENKSGSLYVGMAAGGTTVGEYLTIDLEPPFSANRYLEAINIAQEAGIEFLIIDSLSHAWTGVGGLLEVQGNVANRVGNSYTAWREVTPLHNKLIDRILQCAMHVAVTMRTKVEYAIEENEKGKKTPRKIGMAPVFREGIEYEFSTFFEIGQDHIASTSKDRTGLFDGQYAVITPATGKKFYQWLEAGDMEPTEQAQATDDGQSPESALSLPELVDQAIRARCQGMSAAQKEELTAEIKAITGGMANYRNVKDERTLTLLYERFKEDAR